MSQPQRHRLLQGYPMAPLMRPAAGEPHPLVSAPRDDTRPLIVGVLPHTSCNPSEKGCGFCTFPHEPFDKRHVTAVVDAVIREIDQTASEHPRLAVREVHGVYLGGGTANLTPPEALAALLRQLAASFDLRGAEITLEGVPSYFLTRDARCLDLLAKTPARHRRISMGVQSFDPRWLAKMGRLHFGDVDTLAAAIAAAHAHEMTTSIDLLCNLPGQSAAEGEADVDQAVALGSDQICLYNLVLTAELDTGWARSPEMLAARIGVEEARERWLALRRRLLGSGYVQTTLTNFERAELPAAKRFAYEQMSFDPASYDAIGFGPAAISTLVARDRSSALKWINTTDSAGYLAAMSGSGSLASTRFTYSREDLLLLHLTRNLSRLVVDLAELTEIFGKNPIEALPRGVETLALLEEAKLVKIDASQIALTPVGMFYADTVAGLLAHARVRMLRRKDPDDDDTDDAHSRRGSMG